MFSNLTIRTRLVATMGIMALLIIVISAAGIYGLRSANASLKEVFSNALPSTQAIADSQLSLARARLSLDRAIMHPESNAKENIANAEKDLGDSTGSWQKYLALPQSPEEKQLSDDATAARQKFIDDGLVTMIKLLKEGRRQEADTMMMTGIKSLFQAMNDTAEKLSAYQVRSSSALYEDSQSAYASQLNLAIGGVVAGLLLVGISAFLLMRAIFGPLNQARGLFAAIAAGNLANRIDITRRDEMAALLGDLKQMQDQLSGTVRGVRDSSGSIETASNEIAAGNLDLSRRTEQQAASLEETASSLEELTSTVRQNSDNARQANQLAVSASEVAAKGGQLVSQVVDTMDSISESSRKIADIIGVIDGIAFQTNILALNAAVEAARAGEQGRGFAVVATEVRNLAHRSASAAKDIKSLIDDSVEKVSSGSALVSATGSTMEEVVASVRRVTDIMGEISAAGREQELGIEQINQAVAEMDTVTQQNAALVEQAAAASASMREQAGAMARMVSVFELDKDAAPASALMPAPRQPVSVAVAVAAPAVKAAGRSPARPKAARTAAPAKAAAPAAARKSAAEVREVRAGADEWEEF
jgi:methyl-accepting chemotaxis protein-1 (serine sensor receptor)